MYFLKYENFPVELENFFIFLPSLRTKIISRDNFLLKRTLNISPSDPAGLKIKHCIESLMISILILILVVVS